MSSLNKLVPISFIAGALFTMVAAYLQITHHDSAQHFFVIGLICNVLFIILAIVEVWNTDRVRKQDRVMWTVAILLLGSIGGLLYFIFGRKKI